MAMAATDPRVTGSIPQVHCFPSADVEFARATRARLNEAALTAPRHELRAIVERKLRESYPEARVRPRDPVATISDGLDDLWYAFRDGGAA